MGEFYYYGQVGTALPPDFGQYAIVPYVVFVFSEQTGAVAALLYGIK